MAIISGNKDTVLTIANLCATSVLLVGLATYVFLPFRQNPISEVEYHVTKVKNASYEVTPADDEGSTLAFSVVFYLGLFAGSILGGVTSYLKSPKMSATLFSKLCCLVSFITAGEMANSTDDAIVDVCQYHWEWFCLSACTMAAYLSTYVHTLQSVPGAWIVWVSLGLMGAHWPVASFYSIILVAEVDGWHTILFLQGILILAAQTLQDLVHIPDNNPNGKAKGETLVDLRKNSLGITYLVCLAFLWLSHGYMYYGSYHEIYRDKTALSQAFRCIAPFVFKLLFAALCYWTRQQRPVMAVLLFLNALSLFALATFHSIATNESLISITIQIISFLVSCSWCILWALTVQTFGLGVRYGKNIFRPCIIAQSYLTAFRCLATGLCCGLARLSSLVGSVAVAHRMYRAYPSAISGVVSLVAALVVFLLPEPNMTSLTVSTRRPGRNKKQVTVPETTV